MVKKISSKTYKIGFVGMSHLGLVYSIVTASKGFQVLCYDIDSKKIKNLQKGILNINEPGLDDLMLSCNSNLEWTSNLNDIALCDIIYVSLDIKTNKKGESDLIQIDNYIQKLKDVVNTDSELVILSQVKPGFTRNIKINACKIYYQVETLIFGNAVERALYPERIIIGTKEKNIMLSRKFSKILKSYNCPIVKMNYESAELTKISINLFLIAQVSTTNTISSICERIGADWNDIMPALRLDKRIGEHGYLSPGLGISGGNLERDMATTNILLKENNIKNSMIDTFISNSNERKKWAYNKLKLCHKNLNKNLRISILGLSYKENTDSVKNSPSIETLKRIPNVAISVYDPVVKWNHKWHSNAKVCKNLYDTLDQSDVLIIFTPWKEFKDIDLNRVKKLMKGDLIIDPFNLLSKKEHILNKFQYFCFG